MKSANGNGTFMWALEQLIAGKIVRSSNRDETWINCGQIVRTLEGTSEEECVIFDEDDTRDCTWIIVS